MYFAGAPSSSGVTVQSIDTTLYGSGLRQANISCTGGSKNITIQGGPALEPFTGSWRGNLYSRLSLQAGRAWLACPGAPLAVSTAYHSILCWSGMMVSYYQSYHWHWTWFQFACAQHILQSYAFYEQMYLQACHTSRTSNCQAAPWLFAERTWSLLTLPSEASNRLAMPQWFLLQAMSPLSIPPLSTATIHKVVSPNFLHLLIWASLSLCDLIAGLALISSLSMQVQVPLPALILEILWSPT